MSDEHYIAPLISQSKNPPDIDRVRDDLLRKRHMAIQRGLVHLARFIENTLQRLDEDPPPEEGPAKLGDGQGHG